MLSFKGIDNPSYYGLTGPPNQPLRYHMNWTGCGNSLDLSNPCVIRLVMDSLRYWVEVMHVDGRSAYHQQAVHFPELPARKRWRRVIDTSLCPGEDICDSGAEVALTPANVYIVNPRSTVVLLEI